MMLTELDLTGPQCAALFGYHRQTHYAHWRQGGPPTPVAMLLRLLVRRLITIEGLEALKQ